MRSIPRRAHQTVLFALLLLFTVFRANSSWAHEGHEDAKPAVAVVVPGGDLASVFAVSDSFELLAKYAAPVPTKEATVTLYLSDFRTNRPVAGAAIVLDLSGPASFSGAVAAGSTPGEYVTKLAFPKEGEYAASATITAGEVVDLLDLKAIKVGARYYAATKTPPRSKGGLFWRALAVISVLLAGFTLSFILVRRFARRGRAVGAGVIAVVLACRLVNPSAAFGHGGEDHGAPAQGPSRSLGDPITVLKSAQFLLGIETDIAEKRRLAQRLSVVARIESSPDGGAAIVAPFDGVISFPGGHVYTPGMRVRSGETLAYIEPVFDPKEQLDFTSRKREAEASARKAESDLQVAQASWERAQLLERVLSQKERQEIEAASKNAQANSDAARNVLRSFEAIEKMSNRVAIRSPIDGVIAAVRFSSGNVIGKSSPLLDVVDPKKLWAHGQVYENQLRLFDATARATVVVPALGKIYETRLISRGYTIDVNSRTSHVYFKILDPGPNLIPNLTATLLVETGEAEDTLAVPREALLEADGKRIVFVHTTPEAFQAREVETGWQDTAFVEIVKGLREGERVVVKGNYELRSAAGRGSR